MIFLILTVCRQKSQNESLQAHIFGQILFTRFWFECSRHAGTKSQALSAFGFRELARRGFLSLFYLGEVLDLDLA